jgi:hypothetical protein
VTKPLLPQFENELNRGAVGPEYRRLDALGRLQFIVEVRGDGKMVDRFGKLLHGRFNYVMDSDGLIYAHPNGINFLHHSSFLAGQPVAAAGSMEVYRGRLKFIDNNSGHYWPTIRHLRQMLRELNSRGTDLTKTTIGVVTASSGGGCASVF